MPSNKHDDRGQRPSGEDHHTGRLVVLSSELGPIAHTTCWVRGSLEGYDLLAIPRLHVEQHAVIRIVAGVSPAKLFAGCRVITPDWDDVVGYVGGTWMFFKAARSEFTQVGFVVGEENFDIERAVRGVTKLLT